MKTVVHVNRHIIAFNKKHRALLPVYTVKQGGKTHYCYSVVFHGPSWLVDTRDQRELACGARAWIETNDPVVMIGSISFSELRALQRTTRGYTGEALPEFDEPSVPGYD